MLYSVRLVEPEDGGAPSVEWAGDSRWMEVTIGLLGEEGKRAQKCEQRARGDAARGERQSDTAENFERSGTQRARRFFELHVDVAKSRCRGNDDERRAREKLSNDDARKPVDDRQTMAGEPAADGPAVTDDR